MPVSVRVIPKIQAMQRDLRRINDVIVPAAAVSGLAAGVRKFNTETVRAVSSRTGVPQKILRSKRKNGRQFTGGRIRPFFPSRNRFRGGLDCFWMPVDAVRLGRPRQTRAGSRAGKKNYPGAFIARMPNGKTGIFKRHGPTRLPIKKQTVPLNPDADRIARVKLDRVGRRVAISEFERILTRKLRK